MKIWILSGLEHWPLVLAGKNTIQLDTVSKKKSGAIKCRNDNETINVTFFLYRENKKLSKKIFCYFWNYKFYVWNSCCMKTKINFKRCFVCFCLLNYLPWFSFFQHHFLGAIDSLFFSKRKFILEISSYFKFYCSFLPS